MENRGFQFRPTHQECALYLALKVTGRPFPSGVTIPDRDPYNLQELADIFMETEKNGELYFFTKLTTKGKTGTNNANRTVGKGTWHGDQSENVDHRGRKLGKYTKLSYQEKGSTYDKRFTMTEYTLPKNTKIKYDPFKDYVLCHLEKNERWINGKRVSKSIRESMSNDIIADHVPEADRAHHVAAVDSVELRSDQIFTQPISDQPPLAKEETAVFQNYETLHDADSQNVLQPDNGWANDPRTSFRDHNSRYEYSCKVGNGLVPLQTPAAMFDNGLPPLPGFSNVNSEYPPNSQPYSCVGYNNGLPPLPGSFYGETHVAPLPYYPPPAAPIQDQTSFNPSAWDIRSELAPLLAPTPAAGFNSWPHHSFEVEDEEAYCQIPEEHASQDNDWYDYLMSMDFESGSAGQEPTEQKQPVPNTMPEPEPEPEPVDAEQPPMEAPSHPFHQTTLSTLQFDPCCCWHCSTNFVLDF